MTKVLSNTSFIILLGEVFQQVCAPRQKRFCRVVPPAIHWEKLFLNCFHEVCLVWDQTLQAE